jgi:regulator of protease activity HflC (stomatin/prohibitin superfamily)
MSDFVAVALLLLVLAAVVVVATSVYKRVTIFEYQVGLRYRNGRFVDQLGPGLHWVFEPSTKVKVLDTRTSALTVAGQELVTSDGITVKISLAVQQRIADPVLATHAVDNYYIATYTALQIALREAVGAMSIDDVLRRREEIGVDVLRRSLEPARAVGVEILAVDVKDLMLPPASKKLFAQVIEARQRGLADLEKARGETAALRSLANAARMVQANPALLQLRLLQQLESTSGNTVMLGMPANSTPVPVRGAVPADATTKGKTQADAGADRDA